MCHGTARIKECEQHFIQPGNIISHPQALSTACIECNLYCAPHLRATAIMAKEASDQKHGATEELCVAWDDTSSGSFSKDVSHLEVREPYASRAPCRLQMGSHRTLLWLQNAKFDIRHSLGCTNH
jgi:hypothetical protein